MSVADEPEPDGPDDVMQYATRRLREEPRQRLAAADDIWALHEESPETVGRLIAPAIFPLVPFDSRPESGVCESPRRPLDLQAISETRALVLEMERSGTLFGAAGHFAAAIVVSAVIALFFAIMMPAAWQPDSTQLFAAVAHPFTMSLSR